MDNKEKNFVSAVIYVHNAENRVEEFLKAIIDILQDNFEHSEIICVNDHSDDLCIEKIKGISDAAITTSITVLHMSYFHGLEVAMNAGVDLSIGDYVFEFDNTILDFKKDQVMNIYKKCLSGYDIVSAAPEKKEKITSRLFYRIFDSFTDFSYKLQTESFRVLSRRVINRVSSMNKTVPYRKVVYASSGLKTCTVLYNVVNSVSGYNDIKEKEYRKSLAIDTLILFTDFGYKFTIAMTVLMMIISIFMVVYSIFIYVTSHPVAGWTTTILFLSVVFFGLFGVMTIVIKYLQLLIDLVFKRKHYSFESIEKLTT